MSNACRQCARWSFFTGLPQTCRRCDAAAKTEARKAQAEKEICWYRETGHCGHCGDPGVFCTCTASDPCGCSELHEMGSARLPDALEAFMPVVRVEQGDLFGESV
jgi:hypothetical protein